MEAKGAVEKLYGHFKSQSEALGKVMHLHKAEVGSANKKGFGKVQGSSGEGGAVPGADCPEPAARNIRSRRHETRVLGSSRNCTG